MFFLSRDNETLVRAFRTYILPLLEYNSSIWSPHLIKDIRLIESVQRRFTKRLSKLSGKSYCERLNILHLERLDVRRLRADLILTYKILFGLTVIKANDYFTFSAYTATRGHRYKLCQTKFYTDTRKFTFNNRIVPIWNRLPMSTDFSSLQKFKQVLTAEWLVSFCIEIS